MTSKVPVLKVKVLMSKMSQNVSDYYDVMRWLWDSHQCKAGFYSCSWWGGPQFELFCTELKLLTVFSIERTLCSSEDAIQIQNCNVYNINEVIIQTFS